jgi:hypothetical protein
LNPVLGHELLPLPFVKSPTASLRRRKTLTLGFVGARCGLEVRGRNRVADFGLAGRAIE